MERIRQLLVGEYKFDKLVVMDLGDTNDGTGIYPTQQHHQEVTNVEQQAHGLAKVQAKWLRKLQSQWGTVEYEWVPGNHGRAGRFADEAANWDIVANRYLAYEVEKDGIPVRGNDPSDDPFMRTVTIRGHRYLMYHGHAIRTYSNIPWYGMMLRLSRWSTTDMVDFDVALMGHFHSFGLWMINKYPLFVTGTMVTDDLWALQNFGWQSQSTWWLFGVSARHNYTWKFSLDLAV